MVLQRERENVAGDTSMIVAYLLWWFGGAFQLHHWYLGRDNQGLLGLCISPFLLVTIPVWWLSMIRDMFRIPDYVAAANRESSYVVPRKEAIKGGFPPTFSVSRLFAQLFFAWYFHSVFGNLKLQLLVGLDLPQIDVVMGLVGCAFGAWMVSCCGDEESPFLHVLGGSFGGYFMEYHVWGAVVAAQYFRAFRTDFATKPKLSKGVISNGVKAAFLISLIGFAAITTIEIEVNGENISIREAIKNAMRSEGFSDFIEIFKQFMSDWTEEGFEKAFPRFAEQLKDRFDVDGEDHSYKVLGLQKGASMAEIKKAHRKLALQNHPDKGGSDDKFREIQEAFETLQKVHGAKSNRPKFREPTK